MSDNTEKINSLLQKIDILLKKQESFSREIIEIKEEVNRLQVEEKDQEAIKEAPVANQPATEKVVNVVKKISDPKNESTQPLIPPVPPVEKQAHIKEDIEKFIGENLINKIGIVITVIGVSIGAKYAIDHQLISPLTRIILAYLFGAVLLLVSFRLKKNYENFSAVLLSGSMAIFYFITYAAFSFFSIFPQTIAFALMIIITVITVTASIRYDRQVIAHIGLVGAYAIPFLLSEESGEMLILFTYTAIINIGILVIAFKKYWKSLYYSSFLITWLIYLTWFGSKYQPADHLSLASIFLVIFFLTFYLMFLVNKMLQKEKFDLYDIILLLGNSFIFYGVGYNIISKEISGEEYLGLFTLFNAIIHLIVSILIYRQKLADRNLFFFVVGLVMIFITIAIPIQLNGNWVTLLWIGEAVLLFWIGRTKSVSFYESLSYVLMYLAFFSLLQDWSNVMQGIGSDETLVRIKPVINIRFLTSLIFTVSFGYINFLNLSPKYRSMLETRTELMKLINFSISGILLICLYFTFFNEMLVYFDNLYQASYREISVAGQNFPGRVWNSDLSRFKSIWLINYSLLFISVLSFVNIQKIRSKNLAYVNMIFIAAGMLVYLLFELYLLSELRDSYLDKTLAPYYESGAFNIGIRYFSYIFAAMILSSLYYYLKDDLLQPIGTDLKIIFDLVLYTSLVWIITSELFSWLDILKFTESYKLSLSILWGVCSLLLIGLGIWRNKKHLRIGAIVLFAITLIKLFFYDLSHLNTISKTIVFVTLGVLLLVISFLYNKYRHIITDSDRD